MKVLFVFLGLAALIVTGISLYVWRQWRSEDEDERRGG